MQLARNDVFDKTGHEEMVPELEEIVHGYHCGKGCLPWTMSHPGLLLCVPDYKVTLAPDTDQFLELATKILSRSR